MSEAILVGIARVHIGARLVVGASLSQGTLSGDCHGATKMVASHNDTIGQRTFTMYLSVGCSHAQRTPFVA